MGLGKRQLSADCESGRKGARLCAPTGVALDSRGGFETRPYIAGISPSPQPFPSREREN